MTCKFVDFACKITKKILIMQILSKKNKTNLRFLCERPPIQLKRLQKKLQRQKPKQEQRLKKKPLQQLQQQKQPKQLKKLRQKKLLNNNQVTKTKIRLMCESAQQADF